jgi:hypothetical protein
MIEYKGTLINIEKQKNEKETYSCKNPRQWVWGTAQGIG